MMKQLFLAAALCAVAGASLTGCKKKDDSSIVYDSSATNQTSQSAANQSAQPAPNTPPAPAMPGKHAAGTFGDTTYTESGLGYIDIKKGTGPTPKDGQEVTIMYTGKLTNGETFDSNEDPKFGHPQPFTYHVGVDHMVPGWEEGLSTIKQGGKRRLIVPSDLGYGAAGSGPRVPPNATLVFDLTLVKVK